MNTTLQQTKVEYKIRRTDLQTLVVIFYWRRKTKNYKNKDTNKKREFVKKLIISF